MRAAKQMCGRSDVNSGHAVEEKGVPSARYADRTREPEPVPAPGSRRKLWGLPDSFSARQPNHHIRSDDLTDSVPVDDTRRLPAGA
jgi:hypothetical protein